MRHVVALSGGKDSTALALRLRELNPDTDYDYICTPTGNELPEVFGHLDRMERLLGKSLIRLQPLAPGDGLLNVIDQQNMIPNFRARFCTRILKIEPAIAWLTENAPCVQYVGLRADEGEREGIYGNIEGVQQCYPMRDEWGWGIEEVWRYLEERGIEVPVRTDCALCYHQRIGEWWWLWKKYPAAYALGESVEESRGKTFRTPGRDSWPTSLRELRLEFEHGRRPKDADARMQGNLFNCDMDSMCRVCTL